MKKGRQISRREAQRAAKSEKRPAEKLQTQTAGHGDYTKERHEIFVDLELDELLAAIRQQKGG